MGKGTARFSKVQLTLRGRGRGADKTWPGAKICRQKKDFQSITARFRDEGLSFLYGITILYDFSKILAKRPLLYVYEPCWPGKGFFAVPYRTVHFL
jgi:hypothetical protein